jgi:hypothetical protein
VRAVLAMTDVRLRAGNSKVQQRTERIPSSSRDTFDKQYSIHFYLDYGTYQTRYETGIPNLKTFVL